MESEKDVVYFGRTDFRGSERLFGLKRADRRQHTYVLGKSGTGKTTLMHNMMVQDIVNGEGVCVVDPHGEFVESLLRKIPESRADDVIYFNPADTEYSLGFNVLEIPDPKYKHLVASGLMGIFTKIWSNVWSARMEYVLNNSILALLDTSGTTLLGVMRILVDKEYRQEIISNVKDPVVRGFWINEFEQWRDQFRNEAIAPIQNKVGQFLSTAFIRNIIGQKKSTINILDIMNSGKILLINVSKGKIGEDNSSLLGAMLITKIQLAAMERVRIPEEERIDFFLYVDEFQNFATDSFANILSEARKYRLSLTLGHQYIGQLITDTSTKVRDAIFGNVGTMIVFRVGAADAEFLEKELTPEFTVQDMVNLPNRSIYVKLMINGLTSRPFSASTLPPFKMTEMPAPEDKIIDMSRKRYARPRWTVEKEINEWSGMDSSNSQRGRERGRFSSNDGGTHFQNQRYERLPQRADYHEDLAGLGIEFEKKEGTQRMKERPISRPPPNFRRNESPQRPIHRNVQDEKPSHIVSKPRFAEEKKPDDTPVISLKSLKETPVKQKTPKESSGEVGELKNALEEALKNLE